MERQDEMAVFVRVVDEESFSAAARDLGMTPSAVSKLIGRLEDRLGVRLINRTTRRLSLTEEGHAFYQRCVPILADIEEAERAVTELHAEPRGLLKVNASTAFTQYQVVPLIPDFLARFPELRIQLTMTDSVVNLVEEGVDVAIRVGQLQDSSLIARKLGEVKRVVVASPGYLKQHGEPKSPEELDRHKCLKLSFETSLNRWEFQGSDGPRVVRTAGSFEANNAVVLHEAALAGIGLFRAANFVVAPDIEAGRLVPVLQDYELENRVAIYAVYPHARHLSPKVRAFVDMLVDAFTPVPPWERPD
jgi:DNA-binding transcriptional LysR family regulator